MCDLKKCENCDNEHNGNYGSGRFCSSKCARGFSTKNKRSLINEKVSKTLTKDPHIKICQFCKNEFETKRKNIFCSISCSSTYNCLKNSKTLSDRAKNNNLGKGNRNKYAHGWYESKYAGKVYLESSYEYLVAKELDNNDIKWIRPNHFIWLDGNMEIHKYYADFYLIDYNIYLDPKNDYLIKKDDFKIKQVIKQNKISILILCKNNLTWDKILLKINNAQLV